MKSKQKLKTQILILSEDIKSAPTRIKKLLINKGWEEDVVTKQSLGNNTKGFLIIENDEYRVFVVHITAARIQFILKDLHETYLSMEDSDEFSDIENVLEEYLGDTDAIKEYISKQSFDLKFVMIDVDDIDLSLIREVEEKSRDSKENVRLIVSSPSFEAIDDEKLEVEIEIPTKRLKDSQRSKRSFKTIVTDLNKPYKDTIPKKGLEECIFNLLVKSVEKFKEANIDFHSEELLNDQKWNVEKVVGDSTIKKVPTKSTVHLIISDVAEISDKNELLEFLEERK